MVMKEGFLRAGQDPENQTPTKQSAIKEAVALLVAAGVKDPELKTAVPVEAPKTFSRDQLIIPETVLPQEVQDVLSRAEKAGLTSFEPYHLSGVTLSQDSIVDGWNKKPELWYWQQIANGNIAPDSAKLPDSWVLVDKTPKPDYKDGRQLYENDPLGPLLKQLRKDKKIQGIKGMPETSRFGISHDELIQVVLPEITTILGVAKEQVRLPRAIEFNVIGNFKHPELGETSTWEWFNDKFGGSDRLLGGRSGHGGLTRVNLYWSGIHRDYIAFRPLVVISPKA